MSEPPSAADDIRWMQAALNLGRRGFGVSSPNPAVGALVVRDGVVVGAGATAPGGRPHAERIALDEAGDAARGATLYVTLEPCAHVGRGPACADGAIAAGVKRVVSAMEDPDPRTAGDGHRRLREAGIEVVSGVAEAEARRAHRGHALRVRDGRPMLTLKLAMTADGYAAGAEHDARLAITGEAANLRVQVLRSEHDAIMIGVGTARIDDPLLTVRLPGVATKPLRVVLDSTLSLSTRSRIAASAREFPTLVLTTAAANASRAEVLKSLGVEIEAIAATADARVDLRGGLQALARRGLARIFSEGGPTIGARLVGEGLADEVLLFTAQKPLGRPGLPALDAASRAALGDPRRYREIARSRYGADGLATYERVEGGDLKRDKGCSRAS